MSEDRPWDLYVRDMLEACERVIEFTDALEQGAFVADVGTYYATLQAPSLYIQEKVHPKVLIDDLRRRS